MSNQSHNLYELLYTISDLSNISYRDDFILSKLESMKQSYCETDSFISVNDSRMNSYEYLGYLIYTIEENPSYAGIYDLQTLIDCQTLSENLENEIRFDLEYLSLPDLAKLIKYDIQPIIDDATKEQLSSWDAVRSLLLESVEFSDLVHEIKDSFMSAVPGYSSKQAKHH